MVGLRDSQVHQWAVAGVAVLALCGGEHVRAQSQESACGAGYTALVSVPVQTGEPGDAGGEMRTAAWLGSHRISWYRQATKSSSARCGNNPPHSAGNASVSAPTERSTVHVHSFPARTHPADATTRLVPDGNEDSLPISIWRGSTASSSSLHTSWNTSSSGLKGSTSGS